MKKKWIHILIMVIVILSFIPTAGAEEQSHTNLELNFVLVMDDSGTLRSADPNRLCVEGAKLFVDLLPMTSTRIGTVIFGKGVTNQNDLQNVNSASLRQGIKNNLAQKLKYSQNLTDIGAGLNEAIKMLEKENKPNSAILLFTDGDLRVFAADNQRSIDQIQNAINVANSNRWPIYTIGLNANGQADMEMLENISLNTDAGEPLLAENPSQMAEYFTQIFKRYMDIDSPMTEKTIEDGHVEFPIIQPQMATETNILLTGGNINQVTVIDPQGETINLQNDTDFYYCMEQGYTLVKILLPEPGEWLVDVQGDEDQTVYVQTLNAYDLPLITEISPTEVNRNAKVKFEAYLMYDDSRISMESFYGQTQATVDLLNTQTQVKESYQMDILEDGYEITLPMLKGGMFEAQVIVNGKDFKREGDIYTIQVENQPVESEGDIPDVDLKVGEATNVDLLQYFLDPDEDVLSYSYSMDDSSLGEIGIEGNYLSILAYGKEGSTKVVVLADDRESSIVEQNFIMNVKNTPIIISKRIENISKQIGETLECKLSDFFTDPDSLPVDYKIEAEGISCKYELNKDSLTIIAEKEGVVDFRIIATDSAGSTAEQEFTVKSSSIIGYYFEILLPYLLALAALIIISILIRLAGVRVRGKFNVSVSVEKNGVFTKSFAPYELVPSRAGFGKGKMRFTLRKMLNDYCARLREDSLSETDPADIILDDAFTHVIIKGSLFGKSSKFVMKHKTGSLVFSLKGKEAHPPVRFKVGDEIIIATRDSGVNVRINYI